MRSHRTRRFVVAGLIMLPAMTADASADTCPPLDPTCVLDDVVESGSETVDDTVQVAADAAGLDLEDTIDVAPPIGGIQPPIGDGGETGGTDAGNGGGRWNDDQRGAGWTRGASGAARGPDRGSLTSPATGAAAPRDASTVPVVHQVRPPSPISDRLAAAAVGAAKSLAVVLGLMGAAVAFVLIQNRLDARDPRLALAPLRSDVVRFR
jgi:hypothetical protein